MAAAVGFVPPWSSPWSSTKPPSGTLPQADEPLDPRRLGDRGVDQLQAGGHEERVVGAALAAPFGLRVAPVLAAEPRGRMNHGLFSFQTGRVEHVDSRGSLEEHRAKDEGKKVDAAKRRFEPAAKKPRSPRRNLLVEPC